ncbi:MAG TPA: response regulator [Xanthobacteraceae bacterium]|nr:response regulator [Xanthobacteraceae bacterium]
MPKLRTFSALLVTDGGKSPMVGSAGNSKPRVLLVEDEALVALMIQETLTELDYQVIGPLNTASEALAAARANHFDAAVLDINLGDGLVYTVAEILSVRGVPFVFVTGYDADSVDPRFSDVPILQKPIERDVLQRVFMSGLLHRAAVA